MTKQNRRYVTKEIGKLLSEICRIKGLAEQEYGAGAPSEEAHRNARRSAENAAEIAFSPLSCQKLFRVCCPVWSGVGGSSNTAEASCPAHPQDAIAS